MTFKTKQTVANISGFNVGGQIGEHPHLYHTQHLLRRPQNRQRPPQGEFDKQQAETLINQAEELSEKTGNPLLHRRNGINR